MKVNKLIVSHVGQHSDNLELFVASIFHL